MLQNPQFIDKVMPFNSSERGKFQDLQTKKCMKTPWQINAKSYFARFYHLVFTLTKITLGKRFRIFYHMHITHIQYTVQKSFRY